MRRLIVQALEGACDVLDHLIPWHWHKHRLAMWSLSLDKRWQTGHWTKVDEDED